MENAPAPKPFYLSKTFWINVVAASSMAIPQVQAYIAAHPEVVVSAIASVNVILRFLSHGKIEIS